MPSLCDQLLGSWDWCPTSSSSTGAGPSTRWEMMRSARSSTRPGYLAYAGRFKVDEAASIVEHRVSVSLFPKWIGDVQKRRVDLDGDDLVLESPAITDAAGTSVTPR